MRELCTGSSCYLSATWNGRADCTETYRRGSVDERVRDHLQRIVNRNDRHVTTPLVQDRANFKQSRRERAATPRGMWAKMIVSSDRLEFQEIMFMPGELGCERPAICRCIY
jgi:hypothetical protein